MILTIMVLITMMEVISTSTKDFKACRVKLLTIRTKLMMLIKITYK